MRDLISRTAITGCRNEGRRQKAESGENPHRTKRRGFRRRDADGCDRDGRAPGSRVLRTATPEREKLGRFQISHSERFDKSHDQKGLKNKAEGRMQNAESWENVHRGNEWD